MPKVGDIAPDFSLYDDGGAEITLSKLRGKTVVLWFYPKDSTPGCTKEACGFRDETAAFKKRGVLVFGVSADSVASHEKFKSKFQLTFPLLADKGHKVCELYGVWKNPGISRQTFIIGGDGRITHHFPKVSPAEHAQEILALLK